MPKSKITRKHPPLCVRFWRRVTKGAKNACWLWQGGTIGKYRYGAIRDDQHKSIKSHQASWIIHNGSIPKGLHVCHRCDTYGCVNPRHLFLGTNEDNRKDCLMKDRQARGIRVASSKLSEQQVNRIRYLRQYKHLTYSSLAALFDVHPTTIGSLLRNQTWTHL